MKSIEDNDTNTLTKLLSSPDINVLINQKCPKGETALYLASKLGNARMVLEILNTGCADPDIYVNNYGTALHVATVNDFPEVVALLLVAGANYKIENAFKNIPRLEAKKNCLTIFTGFSLV